MKITKYNRIHSIVLVTFVIVDYICADYKFQLENIKSMEKSKKKNDWEKDNANLSPLSYGSPFATTL